MFPWVYEFSWSAGHLIFLGIFFSVVTLVGVTVLLALHRSSRSLQGKGLEQLLWKAEFADLPLSARSCRHELSGETKERSCPNRFDCRECQAHLTYPSFLWEHTEERTEEIMGISLPLDRFYHRGHTWAKQLEDGSFEVGLDPIARRIVGEDAEMLLPAIGTELIVNGTGLRVRKGKLELRILSPLDGEVVAHGCSEGSLFRVKPKGGEPVRHLLRGSEVVGWARRELDRLQLLAAPAGSASLADGGELADDLPSRDPSLDWDGILGAFFLQA